MARYALVIGIAQYENGKNLPNAANDAEAIACLLEQHHYNVTRLPCQRVDDTGYVVTSEQTLSFDKLVKELRLFLNNRAKHQEAVIYFAGHGFQATDPVTDAEIGYLATSNSQGDGTRAIPFASFNALLKEAELASLVVLMDCCHAGNLAKTPMLLEPVRAGIKQRKNSVLLAACRDFERAREMKTQEHGIFTAAVLEGLSEQNARQGMVTSSDLIGFVSRRLHETGQEPIHESGGIDIPLVTYSVKDQGKPLASLPEVDPVEQAFTLIQDDFELRDQAFFEKLKRNPGRSHILKLPVATWSLILQGNYVERDQQEEALQLAWELAQIHGTSLLLISGEPGAGKTALMRWLAYSLFLENGLILEKKSQDSFGWLECLQDFVEMVGDQHVYVIADDLFRDNDLLQELERNEFLPNLTIIGTMRPNENCSERLEELEYQVRCLELQRPSELEKNRVLIQVCKDKQTQSRVEQMSMEERQQLMKSPVMLVLMLQLSEGKIFHRIIANAITKLPNSKSRPSYQVFGLICSFFQYGAITPPEIIELCIPEFRRYHQLVLSDLKGLISVDIQAGYEGLTSIHELIAQVAMETREKQNLENGNLLYSWISAPNLVEQYVETIIYNISLESDVQRRWICRLISLLSRQENMNLARGVLSEYSEKFHEIQRTSVNITELSYYTNVYRVLGLFPDCVRCERLILEADPDDSNNRNIQLSMLEKYGDSQQILVALGRTKTWLNTHPDDTNVRQHYLALIGRYGSIKLKQETLEQIEIWLNLHPDNANVRREYLTLVGRYGSREKQKAALEQTAIWLSANPNDTDVRQHYLSLIDRYGSPHLKQTILEQTLAWLSSNPNNTNIRLQYLVLISSCGDEEQKREALRRMAIWLNTHSNNINVRQKYLVLLEKCGSREQRQAGLEQTAIWLSEHPQDTHIRLQYLVLIRGYGSKAQHQVALEQTASWLSEHPNNTNVRLQHLVLIGDCGSREQQQAALEQTASWLSENPRDSTIRNQYLVLIESFGGTEQQQRALEQTAIWLNAYPNSNNVRNQYLVLIEKCGSREQTRMALEQTEHWLDDYPNNAHIRQQYLSLTESYGDMEQIQLALEKTRLWLNSNTNDACVRAQYLLLIGKLGNMEKKRIAYENQRIWFSQERQIPPHCWTAFLEFLSDNFEFSYVEDIVRLARLRKPDCAWIASAIFSCFQDDLDYGECLELADFIDRSSLHPRRWIYRVDVANFFRDNGELERAESIYRRTIKSARKKLYRYKYLSDAIDYSSINYARLLLCAKRPDYNKIIHLIRPILDKDKQHATCHWVMAQYYQIKGRNFKKKTIQSFRNSIAFDPDKEGFFWFQFGCFYRDSLEEVDQAKRCFEKSLTQKVTFAACLDLAELEYEDGHYSKSRYYFKKGLSLPPSNRVEREERGKYKELVKFLTDKLGIEQKDDTA